MHKSTSATCILRCMRNLWSLLGGRYLPSMLYKVRMITVDANAVIGQVPIITNPQFITGN